MPKSYDDEDEDRPRKKFQRRETSSSGWSNYKKSPVRFIVLGLLLAVMMVMGYMLYLKKQREQKQNEKTSGLVPASHVLCGA